MLEVPSWVGMLFCYRDGGKITSVLFLFAVTSNPRRACIRATAALWGSGSRAGKPRSAPGHATSATQADSGPWTTRA